MVYVLNCEKFDRHYTGFSSDIEQWMISHNELRKKSRTKRYQPWKVVLTEKYEMKAEAMRREK